MVDIGCRIKDPIRLVCEFAKTDVRAVANRGPTRLGIGRYEVQLRGNGEVKWRTNRDIGGKQLYSGRD